MNTMRILLLVVIVAVLAACGGNAGAGDPAKAVENYLQAKVSGDKDALRGLLCADLEANLDMEASAFVTVTGATLEDMACQREGDSNVVACSGQITATYGTEKTSFPLTRYNVKQEDGEWKWCGEAG